MLIVATIYCMEAETAKKFEAVKPVDEPAVLLLPEDGREFLAMYQGVNRVPRSHSHTLQRNRRRRANSR